MIGLLGAGIGLLALAGAPLFIVIGAGALLGFFALEIDTSAVIIPMYSLASSPTLVALPLFAFAGYLLAESGTPKRLVNLAHAFFGWMPGGVAVVTLLTCAGFTAFTGASGVTIIALGGLLYPILTQDGYPEKFSLGLLTTCGSLGLLFPPSLAIILYGVVSQTSIEQLFQGGMLPGILLIVLLSAYSIWKGRNNRVPTHPFAFRKAVAAVRESIWELPLPALVLWGIYGGYFTPTEAASITAFYVLIVEVVVYRELHLFHDVPRIMQESMLLVGGILIILGTALGFTSFLIDQQVPMKILDVMQEYLTSRLAFLIVLNVFLLIVGCLMDIFSATFVVVPLIAPIAAGFGVHPVHLGIIFLTNLEIGYLTPPVGINLFISSFRFQKPVVTLYRATLPFLCVLLLGLLLITYFPALTLWLVESTGELTGAGVP